jgi:parallel beta-helix repeat protein
MSYNNPLATRSTILNTLVSASRTGSEIELQRNVTYTLNANLTLQDDRVLVIPQGTLIQLGAYNLYVGPAYSSGKRDQIRAGKYKIFDVNSTGRVLRIANAVVFPEWFGAKGDGSTDSTTAIQYCFDLLTSGQFNKVIELEGVYNITNTITSKYGYTTLRGSGIQYGSSINLNDSSLAKSLLQIGDGGTTPNQYGFNVIGVVFTRSQASTGYGDAAIYVNKMNIVNIRDCNIYGSVGAEYFGYGIYVNASQNVAIENNVISATRLAGILGVGSSGTFSELIVNHNYMREGLTDGIWLYDYSQAFVVDNIMYGYANAGIKVSASDISKVIGTSKFFHNDLDTSNYGFHLGYAASCQFSDNWMSSINNVAVYIENSCSNLQFSGNHIYSEQHGFYITSGSGVTIVDNTLIGVDVGAGPYNGIELQVGAANINIIGNKFENWDGYGIDAHATTGWVNIAGNQFLDCGTWLYDSASGKVKWRTHDGDNLNQVNVVESYTIASAATITLPDYAKVFSITGTTDITAITASWEKRQVVLVFEDVLTVSEGGNLHLQGDFISSAEAALTLVCNDSVNWVEVSRTGEAFFAGDPMSFDDTLLMWDDEILYW